MIALLVGIGTMLLRGLVTRTLWGWFLVPLGVPAVSLAGAMGASALISYVTKQIDPEASPPPFAKVVMSEVVWALITVGFGWIFYWFA